MQAQMPTEATPQWAGSELADFTEVARSWRPLPSRSLQDPWSRPAPGLSGTALLVDDWASEAAFQCAREAEAADAAVGTPKRPKESRSPIDEGRPHQRLRGTPMLMADQGREDVKPWLCLSAEGLSRREPAQVSQSQDKAPWGWA